MATSSPTRISSTFLLLEQGGELLEKTLLVLILSFVVILVPLTQSARIRHMYLLLNRFDAKTLIVSAQSTLVRLVRLALQRSL